MKGGGNSWWLSETLKILCVCHEAKKIPDILHYQHSDRYFIQARHILQPEHELCHNNDHIGRLNILQYMLTRGPIAAGGCREQMAGDECMLNVLGGKQWRQEKESAMFIYDNNNNSNIKYRRYDCKYPFDIIWTSSFNFHHCSDMTSGIVIAIVPLVLQGQQTMPIKM